VATAAQAAGQMVPSVQQYIITAYDQVKDYDAALAKGERFLQRYPTSPIFSTVQILMNALSSWCS
jgi:outer membrane protein assembly factor BamD (BamD/ComL family)